MPTEGATVFVTAAAIAAASWVRDTYVRGKGFESSASSCRDFPELTLTHGVRHGRAIQALHVAGPDGRHIVHVPPGDPGAAYARAAQLLNQLRAGKSEAA